jgi:hypothetical protein
MWSVQPAGYLTHARRQLTPGHIWDAAPIVRGESGRESVQLFTTSSSAQCQVAACQFSLKQLSTT